MDTHELPEEPTENALDLSDDNEEYIEDVVHDFVAPPAEGPDDKNVRSGADQGLALLPAY